MSSSKKISSRWLTATLLALLALGALAIRVALDHEAVLGGEMVRFQGNDAWYHARLIDNLVANFPQPLRFDPLARFPGGEPVRTPPFFDLLIAGTALVVGRGDPSPRLVETVAAYVPPVLGALTLIPVFFVGRRLFGRTAGLLAAAVLAVIPGQFLARSALGATDHHVAESALTALAMLLSIEAVARIRDGGNALSGWSWAAGVFFALYFLTWSGASLFAAIVAAWAVLQIVVDHLRRAPPEIAPAIFASARSSAALVVVPALTPALIVVLLSRRTLYRADVSTMALGGAIALVLVVLALSRWLATRKVARWWIVPAAALLPMLAIALLAAVAPGSLDRIRPELDRMIGNASTGTVLEGMALLFPRGRFDAWAAWLQFASGSFLAPIALAQLVHRTWKEPRAERLLFIVWTVAVVLATLGQNRFGYYAAINVSVLTGAAAATVIGWAASDATSARAERLGYGALAAAAVILLVFVPCLRVSIPTLSSDDGPSTAWVHAVDWLRENTPDPFPDGDEYLRHHEMPEPPGFAYPSTAYGVLNWWDQGYLITRRGRRIPTSNPTQSGSFPSARFLLESDETRAAAMLEELGARYVMVDRTLLFMPAGPGAVAGKFPALTTYAGRDEGDFLARYWARGEDGALLPISMLRPEYYRTMLARLYLFGGVAFEPKDSTWLVKSTPEQGPSGEERRVVTDMRPMASWPEATAFLESSEGDGYEVLGRDPLESCVPLEALETLRQVYPEDDRTTPGQPAEAREVRIFATTH